MANVLTVVNETEYLVISNLFEQTAGADVAVVAQAISAEQIFNLVKNGSFGFGRKQIVDAFMVAGGKTAAGQPASIKNVIALCLEISAQAYKNSNAGQVRIWFDAFTGRIELSANGQRDNLTIWAKTACAAA